MHSVYAQWNLVIGVPGEEEDVYKKYLADIPSLMHLPPPTGAYPVSFDRYSPYFVQAKQYELDLHPCDFYKLTGSCGFRGEVLKMASRLKSGRFWCKLSLNA